MCWSAKNHIEKDYIFHSKQVKLAEKKEEYLTLSLKKSL